MAATGDTLPVGALLGVLAGADTPDAEVDAFVSEFQANFVPEATDADDGGDQTETIQVGEFSVNYLRQGSDARTAVLLHGFGGDLNNWLFNHAALAEHRTVIALDLPGHGLTTKKVANGNLLCMVHVLQNLMERLGVAQADWVGHSMGGAIAMQLALTRPDLVRSLTLLASAGLGPEINTDYLQGFAASRNRRELRPHVRQLFADPSLVTRQLVADLLKYKRLDDVQECLEALAYQLSDAAAQADAVRPVLDSGSHPHPGDLGRRRPHHPGRPRPRPAEPGQRAHLRKHRPHGADGTRPRRKPPHHRLLDHPALTEQQFNTPRPSSHNAS